MIRAARRTLLSLLLASPVAEGATEPPLECREAGGEGWRGGPRLCEGKGGGGGGKGRGRREGEEEGVLDDKYVFGMIRERQRALYTRARLNTPNQH